MSKKTNLVMTKSDDIQGILYIDETIFIECLRDNND